MTINKMKYKRITIFCITNTTTAPSLRWNRSKFQFIWYLLLKRCAYKCMYITQNEICSKWRKSCWIGRLFLKLQFVKVEHVKCGCTKNFYQRHHQWQEKLIQVSHDDPSKRIFIQLKVIFYKWKCQYDFHEKIDKRKK